MVRKLNFFTLVALGSGFGLARPGAAVEYLGIGFLAAESQSSSI
jgi:hypothetical protein